MSFEQMPGSAPERPTSLLDRLKEQLTEAESGFKSDTDIQGSKAKTYELLGMRQAIKALERSRGDVERAAAEVDAELKSGVFPGDDRVLVMAKQFLKSE